MFNVKSRKLVLTLFCSLALVLVLTDGASANPHLDGHRMLRRRSPELFGRQSLGDIIDVGPNGAGEDPVKGDGSPNSPSPVSSPSPSSGTSLPPSPSPNIPVTGILNPSSDSSVTSTSSSSSSSPPPSPTSTPATPTPPPENSPTTSPTTTTPPQKTEFKTVTSSDSNSSGTSVPTNGAASKTKTTLTIIIAIAASIGGIAIIWTLIRKWKFKPSDKFEDRMQPIDWQPTGPEESVPGLHRATSTHSHASFYSGGHESDHNSSQQHGNSIRRGVSPLPEHDFTPGPSHLAPGAGYADLARGPSPQPPMSQVHEAQYGVPLHHQGAYDTYGAVNGQRY